MHRSQVQGRPAGASRSGQWKKRSAICTRVETPCRPRCRSRQSLKALANLQQNRPLRVMIAGAPATGKGTQCAKIVETYNLVHISAGDLLREEVRRATEQGKVAKEYMNQGLLVPNEVVVHMVKNRVAAPDAQRQGWLLDGYPRSASQAEAIEKEEIRPDIFILLEVPDSTLIERVIGRRQDPETGEIYHLKHRPPPQHITHRLQQRSDDTEEKARVRLETHHKNVEDVIGYYEKMLVRIDGNQNMDKVFANICQALDNIMTTDEDAMELEVMRA